MNREDTTDIGLDARSVVVRVVKRTLVTGLSYSVWHAEHGSLYYAVFYSQLLLPLKSRYFPHQLVSRVCSQ
jgi:hypothetical protein